MQPPKDRDRMMEVLDAAHDAVVTEYVRQLRAANPLYANLPLDRHTQAAIPLVDHVFESLRTHNPAILSQFLQMNTRARLEQGFSGESQIQAAQVMEAVIRETLRRDLAGDPAELANAERRIDKLAATGRNAIGRILLSMMTPPPKE